MLLPFLSILLISCGGNSNKPTEKKAKHDTVVVYKSLTALQKENYVQQITPIYNSLLGKSGFNGGILIAKNGDIVFEDYKGYINYKTKELITANSQFHIASVSKTFTAMAVLKLMEEGKIDIEADVKTYLPTFPYRNITVKNLLSHRSGLPNYVHLMEGTIVEVTRTKNKKGKWIKTSRVISRGSDSKKLVTNDAVLKFLVEKYPVAEALPNKRFKYCNTNFALLALIVEKVTGVDFPTYMQQNIFDPLGMKNTYVFSIKDTAKYTPSYKGNFVPYGIEKLDCVYGDKNIYSTPRDILLWDQALYANKVVSAQTLQMAYTPYSNEKAGTHNYGLGWRLFTFPNYTLPYHNGWWHGNNAVFTRLVKDSATIIVLGNKYNPRIYKAKELAAIFSAPMDSSHVEE